MIRIWILCNMSLCSQRYGWWDIQYNTIVNNKTGIPGESNSNTCRLGCISLNDNLHSPLSPTGLKSQEERQKEEICKFWNCESTSPYMLFVLHFIQRKKYNHFINLCPFQRIVTVWPPLTFFLCTCTCLCFRLLCCPSKWSPSTPLWISSVEGKSIINEADLQSVWIAAIEDVLTFACVVVVVVVVSVHFILQFSKTDWSDF